MTVSDFLRGRRELRVPAEKRTELINLLLRRGIRWRDGGEKDGRWAAVVAFSAVRVLRGASVEGLEIGPAGGWVTLLRAARGHVGLAAGAALALWLTVWGSSVIWRVEPVGCREVPPEKVKALLAEYGVAPGSRKKDIDVDAVQERLAADSPEIAWISVNVRGTVAYAEIVEQREPDKEQPDPAGWDGVNLVAARDGVIERFLISAGEPAAAPGTPVLKGELLVSGIEEGRNVGMRVLRARGEVWARTRRTLTVTAEKKREVKTPVGREITAAGIIFFGKEKIFFKNSRFDAADCDTIKKTEYPLTARGRSVPVGVVTLSRLLTETETVCLTAGEAEAAARLELNRRIRAELGENVQILARTVTVADGEEALTLVCELQCLEDIAEPRGFTVQ